MKSIASLQLIVLLAFACASADTVPENSIAANSEEIQMGLAAVDEQRCGDALPLLRNAADSNTFGRNPEETRRNVLGKLVDCAFELQQADITLIYLQQLSEIPGDDADYRLRQLFWVAHHTSNTKLVVDTLQRISNIGQGAVNAIPHDLLHRIYRDMSRLYLDIDLRYKFLRVLYEADYKSTNPFRSSDWFMVEYARMAADRGDMAAVENIILGLTDPRILLDVRIDRRFDQVRRKRRVDTHLNLEAAAEREIVKIRQLVQQYPGSLEGHVNLSDALETARRYEEALNAIEPIAERLMEPGGRDRFFDADEEENWALERYADALAQLGHQERADEIHFGATMVTENSHVNVSQQINFAANQFSKGNYKRSLAALSKVADTSTSDYGNILVHLYTVCAVSMGNIQRDYLESLSFLLENERRFGSQVLRAYLCMDELDSAAQSIIRRLEHPEERIKVLGSLQVYEDEREHLDKLQSTFGSNSSTSTLSPGDLLDLRLDAVRKREDVLEAVNAVGRIELVPLDSGHRN